MLYPGSIPKLGITGAQLGLIWNAAWVFLSPTKKSKLITCQKLGSQTLNFDVCPYLFQREFGE